MKTNSNRDKIMILIMGLAMLVQALLVFYAQGRYSFMLEDMDYSINMGTGAPLAGLGDVFANIPYILKKDGGSVLSLSILQIIILLGDTFANIFNTLTMLLVAFLISRIVSPRKFDILYMAMPFFMMTALNSDWRYAYLWQFGIVNYLLPAIPFLIYLFYLMKEINYSDNKTSIAGAVLSVLGAFFTSWANAAYGFIAILLSIASILIIKKLLAKPLGKWVIGGLIASILGFALYMAVPGNYGKNSMMNGVFLKFSIFPAVVLALLMLAISLRSGSYLSISQILLIGVLFISVVLRYVIAVIPGIAINGIAMCTLIVAITLFCNLFNNIKKDNPKNVYWGYIISAVSMLYAVLVIIEDVGGVG